MFIHYLIGNRIYYHHSILWITKATANPRVTLSPISFLSLSQLLALSLRYIYIYILLSVLIRRDIKLSNNIFFYSSIKEDIFFFSGLLLPQYQSPLIGIKN